MSGLTTHLDKVHPNKIDYEYWKIMKDKMIEVTDN